MARKKKEDLKKETEEEVIVEEYVEDTSCEPKKRKNLTELNEENKEYLDLLMSGVSVVEAYKKAYKKDKVTGGERDRMYRLMYSKTALEYMIHNCGRARILADPRAKVDALKDHIYNIAMGGAKQTVTTVDNKGNEHVIEVQPPFRDQITASALYFKLEAQAEKDKNNIDLKPNEVANVIDDKVNQFISKYKSAAVTMQVPTNLIPKSEVVIDRETKTRLLDEALEAEFLERTEVKSDEL